MIYIVSNRPQLYNDFEDIEYRDINFCIQYFQNIKYIGVDTETSGFSPHSNDLLLLQLGTFTDQFVIDNSIDITILKELFEDNSKVFLLHNAKFDLRFLYKYSIVPNSVYDTFLAEAVLTTGYGNDDILNLTSSNTGVGILGLADLCMKYLNIDMDKTARGLIHKGSSYSVIKYAATDVKYLEAIMNKQLVEIQKFDLSAVVELENKVVKVFALMEFNGINFDKDIWNSVSSKTKEMLLNIEEECDKALLNTPLARKYKAPIQGNLFFSEKVRATNVNWGSSTQKLKILKELGLNINSTSDKDLSVNINKHPIIPLLGEYNKYAKLVSSFGDSVLDFINPTTGKIHPEVRQVLSTGRISMKNPNIQQMPSHGDLAKLMRSAFIPQKGYKIVGGDYSGFELAIIAEYSKDPVWLDTLTSGGNLHSVLCAMTFDIPESEVKTPFPKKPSLTYRDVQKAVDFGLAYGMSKFKLSNKLQITQEEAEIIIKKFFSKVPKVEKFLNFLGEYGRRKGYSVTPYPMKRIRWFPGWKGDATDFGTLGAIERASKNMPIQGTNANCIKYALVKLQEIIDKNNYPVRILFTVHDEIQTECLEAFSEKWLKILEETMIQSAKYFLKTVPVSADCKISDCWTK